MSSADESPPPKSKGKGKSKKKRKSRVFEEPGTPVHDEPQPSTSTAPPKPHKVPSKLAGKQKTKGKGPTKRPIVLQSGLGSDTEASADEVSSSPVRSSGGSSQRSSPRSLGSSASRSSSPASSIPSDSIVSSDDDSHASLKEAVNAMVEMLHYLQWIQDVSDRDEILTKGNIDMVHLRKEMADVMKYLKKIIPKYGVKKWEDHTPHDVRVFFRDRVDKSWPKKLVINHNKCYEMQKLIVKALAKVKSIAARILTDDGLRIIGSNLWKNELEHDTVRSAIMNFVIWIDKHPNPSLSLIGTDEEGKEKVYTFKRSDTRSVSRSGSKTKITRESSFTRYGKKTTAKKTGGTKKK